MTDEKIEEISNRYIELYEKFTGEKFKKKPSENILKRVHDNVEKWIKERNLEKSILLHNPVDNIMDKYLESSICVISSRYHTTISSTP